MADQAPQETKKEEPAAPQAAAPQAAAPQATPSADANAKADPEATKPKEQSKEEKERTSAAVDTLKKELTSMWSTDRDKILDTLRGKSKEELAAIRAEYQKSSGGQNLDDMLNDAFDGKGHKQQELLASLEGSAEGRRDALSYAMQRAAANPGDMDAAKITSLLEQVQALPEKERDAALAQIKGDYKKLTKGVELEDVVKAANMSPLDLVRKTNLSSNRALALLKGGKEGQQEAAMIAAAQQQKGVIFGLGGDKAAVAGAMDRMTPAERAKAVATLKANGMDVKAGEAGDAAKAVAEGDRKGAAVAQLDQALNGSITGVNKKQLMSALELKPIKTTKPDGTKMTPAEIQQAKDEQAADHKKMIADWEKKSGKKLDAVLADNLNKADLDKARCLAKDGKVDDITALRYAMKGSVFTDREGLKKALRNSDGSERSPEEMQKLLAAYDKKYKEGKEGPDAKADLNEALLSGRKSRDQIEVNHLLKGRTDDPDEIMRRGQEIHDYERKGLVAGGMDLVSNTGTNLDEQHARLKAAYDEIKKKGGQPSPEDLAELKELSSFQKRDANVYKEAKADKVNGLAEGAGVGVMIAVTALTGGAAAPAVAAALAGGGTTMAIKAGMRGGDYTPKEAVMDLGGTAVNAASMGVMKMARVAKALGQAGSVRNFAGQTALGGASGFAGGAVEAGIDGKSADEVLAHGLKGAAVGTVAGGVGASVPGPKDAKSTRTVAGGVGASVPGAKNANLTREKIAHASFSGGAGNAAGTIAGGETDPLKVIGAFGVGALQTGADTHGTVRAETRADHGRINAAPKQRFAQGPHEAGEVHPGMSRKEAVKTTQENMRQLEAQGMAEVNRRAADPEQRAQMNEEFKNGELRRQLGEKAVAEEAKRRGLDPGEINKLSGPEQRGLRERATAAVEAQVQEMDPKKIDKLMLDHEADKVRALAAQQLDAQNQKIIDKRSKPLNDMAASKAKELPADFSSMSPDEQKAWRLKNLAELKVDYAVVGDGTAATVRQANRAGSVPEARGVMISEGQDLTRKEGTLKFGQSANELRFKGASVQAADLVPKNKRGDFVHCSELAAANSATKLHTGVEVLKNAKVVGPIERTESGGTRQLVEITVDGPNGTKIKKEIYVAGKEKTMVTAGMGEGNRQELAAGAVEAAIKKDGPMKDKYQQALQEQRSKTPPPANPEAAALAQVKGEAAKTNMTAEEALAKMGNRKPLDFQSAVVIGGSETGAWAKEMQARGVDLKMWIGKNATPQTVAELLGKCKAAEGNPKVKAAIQALTEGNEAAYGKNNGQAKSMQDAYAALLKKQTDAAQAHIAAGGDPSTYTAPADYLAKKQELLAARDKQIGAAVKALEEQRKTATPDQQKEIDATLNGLQRSKISLPGETVRRNHDVQTGLSDKQRGLEPGKPQVAPDEVAQGIDKDGKRLVYLDDGRIVKVDKVVSATGQSRDAVPSLSPGETRVIKTPDGQVHGVEGNATEVTGAAATRMGNKEFNAAADKRAATAPTDSRNIQPAMANVIGDRMSGAEAARRIEQLVLRGYPRDVAAKIAKDEQEKKREDRAAPAAAAAAQ